MSRSNIFLSKPQLNHNTTPRQPNTIQQKLGLTRLLVCTTNTHPPTTITFSDTWGWGDRGGWEVSGLDCGKNEGDYILLQGVQTWLINTWTFPKPVFYKQRQYVSCPCTILLMMKKKVNSESVSNTRILIASLLCQLCLLDRRTGTAAECGHCHHSHTGYV